MSVTAPVGIGGRRQDPQAGWRGLGIAPCQRSRRRDSFRGRSLVAAFAVGSHDRPIPSVVRWPGCCGDRLNRGGRRTAAPGAAVLRPSIAAGCNETEDLVVATVAEQNEDQDGCACHRQTDQPGRAPGRSDGRLSEHDRPALLTVADLRHTRARLPVVGRACRGLVAHRSSREIEWRDPCEASMGLANANESSAMNPNGHASRQMVHGTSPNFTSGLRRRIKAGIGVDSNTPFPAGRLMRPRHAKPRGCNLRRLNGQTVWRVGQARFRLLSGHQQADCRGRWCV